MSTILFVEDDHSLQMSVAFILERAGHDVVCVGSGEEALFTLETTRPDLVLLDVILPEMNGLTVCRHLRARSDLADLPIILTTTRNSVDEVVEGLMAEADDYMTKPYHPRVLLARITTVLRRLETRAPTDPGTLRSGRLRLDQPARDARLDDQPLELTSTEFDLLQLFMSRPDEVLSRTEILEALRSGITVTERVVDFQISNLRKKLGTAAHQIKTVRGFGYKFVADP